MTARRCLTTLFVLGCTAALAACAGGGATPSAAVPPATAVGAALPAAGTVTSKELNLYGWSEYVPQEILDRFGKEYGVTVHYDTYASNEELLAKLKAGNSRYDVIVPSDYLVTLMGKQQMLEPLDKKRLINLDNIAPEFLGRDFDPKNDVSVPYQWGTTGIAVNTAKVAEPVTSFADLWKPAFKDRLVVLDDQREMLGIALVQLGFDRNSTDPKELAAARDKLVALKPNIRVYDSDSPKTQLLSGEADAGIVYNGEAALAGRENPAIKYVLPADGCGIWFDNLAIPRGAPHPDAALAFIDFVLRPENSALITRDFPYSNPNQAGLDYVRANLPEIWTSYQASLATNPPRDVVAHCQPVKDVGDALPLYGEMWTQVKGSE
jgi:spermidine/putrescine-binding protein